jgi:hypothetical protein
VVQAVSCGARRAAAGATHAPVASTPAAGSCHPPLWSASACACCARLACLARCTSCRVCCCAVPAPALLQKAAADGRQWNRQTRIQTRIQCQNQIQRSRGCGQCATFVVPPCASAEAPRRGRARRPDRPQLLPRLQHYRPPHRATRVPGRQPAAPPQGNGRSGATHASRAQIDAQSGIGESCEHSTAWALSGAGRH